MEVERTGESNPGACACCGNATRVTWGFIRESRGPTLAAYFIRSAPGHPEHEAWIAVAPGEWGRDDPSSRRLVAFEVRRIDGKPELRLIDAQSTPWGKPGGSGALGTSMTLADVLLDATLADASRVLVDVLLLQEDHLRFLSEPEGTTS